MRTLLLSLFGFFVAWLSWAVLRAKRAERIDVRHGFTWAGVHGGWLEHNHGKAIARVPWEGRTGSLFRIALPEAHWVWPIAAPLTAEEQIEFRRKLEVWARERGFRYEIADKLTGSAPPESSLSCCTGDAA